jgi:hypothetical protein
MQRVFSRAKVFRSVECLAVATLFAALLVACSSSDAVVEQPPLKPLREHEESFDPAAYRPPEAETPIITEEPETAEREDQTVWIERTENVMGFRVQLHSTTNVDEAQTTLAKLRTRLDSIQVDPGRIDIGYDAPYYKIRAGDFLVRSEAEEFRRTLHEAGMPEAWVVRDRVLRIIREKMSK